MNSRTGRQKLHSEPDDKGLWSQQRAFSHVNLELHTFPNLGIFALGADVLISDALLGCGFVILVVRIDRPVLEMAAGFGQANTRSLRPTPHFSVFCATLLSPHFWADYTL